MQKLSFLELLYCRHSSLAFCCAACRAMSFVCQFAAAFSDRVLLQHNLRPTVQPSKAVP
jgi:hypothetical protein